MEGGFYSNLTFPAPLPTQSTTATSVIMKQTNLQDILSCPFSTPSLPFTSAVFFFLPPFFLILGWFTVNIGNGHCKIKGLKTEFKAMPKSRDL